MNLKSRFKIQEGRFKIWQGAVRSAEHAGRRAFQEEGEKRKVITLELGFRGE